MFGFICQETVSSYCYIWLITCEVIVCIDLVKSFKYLKQEEEEKEEEEEETATHRTSIVHNFQNCEWRWTIQKLLKEKNAKKKFSSSNKRSGGRKDEGEKEGEGEGRRRKPGLITLLLTVSLTFYVTKRR